MARRYIAPLILRAKTPDDVDRVLRSMDDRIRELVLVQSSAALLSGADAFTKAQVVALVALPQSATVGIDGRSSNNYSLLLTQNTTISNPVNVKAGQIINISLTQDATGSRTATWGSAWKFPGGSSTVSTAAGAIDMASGRVEAESDGVATTILCNLSVAYS